jgi:hypothetical protein
VDRVLDYYAALGVKKDASVEEIDRAYRALARKVHPDRNAGDAERADARMKQLNQIRETLTDPLLRVAYDDQLRRDRQSEPPSPRPQAPPAERPEQRWRQAAPPRYEPHPHVAPFLRTHVEEMMAAHAQRREQRPAVAILVAGTLIVAAVAFLWPRAEPRPLRVAASTPAPAPPPPPAPARKGGVEVVRGDTEATRRAIRKTSRVVPVGVTLDEVVHKFGPPDRIESHPTPGTLTLIYGNVRVEMVDGRVVGGTP